VKISRIYLSGLGGYLLCTLLVGENLIWVGNSGSAINLAAITLERYLKVVHPVWTKNKLHSRVIYASVAFSWIGSLIYNFAATFSTTIVVSVSLAIRWEVSLRNMHNEIFHFEIAYLKIHEFLKVSQEAFFKIFHETLFFRMTVHMTNVYSIQPNNRYTFTCLLYADLKYLPNLLKNREKNLIRH